jgi:hypothetical protein
MVSAASCHIWHYACAGGQGHCQWRGQHGAHPPAHCKCIPERHRRGDCNYAQVSAARRQGRAAECAIQQHAQQSRYAGHLAVQVWRLH